MTQACSGNIVGSMAFLKCWSCIPTLKDEYNSGWPDSSDSHYTSEKKGFIMFTIISAVVPGIILKTCMSINFGTPLTTELMWCVTLFLTSSTGFLRLHV